MTSSNGEAKPFKVALAAGDAVWFIGGFISLLTHSKETGGQLGLTEWIGPRGMCAPPHSHTLEAEGFYILEGDVAVTVGGRKFECQRGDFVYVPKKAPHEFMVNSATAKFLVTITPAGFEEFFRELSEGPAKAPTWPASGGSVPPIERVIEVGTKYQWRPELEKRPLDAEIEQRIFYSAAHDGKRSRLGGGLIVLKATREQTEDKFSISEWFGLRGWGIPSLKYTRQGTSYYGLDGEFQVSPLDGSPFSLRAGDMIYVPCGVSHSVEIKTGFARMLICATESAVEDLFLAGQPMNNDEITLNSKVSLDQNKLRRVGSDTAAWALE